MMFYGSKKATKSLEVDLGLYPKGLTFESLLRNGKMKSQLKEP